jgi:hypothetical protein
MHYPLYMLLDYIDCIGLQKEWRATALDGALISRSSPQCMVKCCAGVGAGAVSSSFAEVPGLQSPKPIHKFNAK